MQGRRLTARWIGLGLVGALAAVAAVAVVVTSGQHPAAATEAQPATSTAMYTGVWAPGSGPQVWRTSMSATALSSWDRTYITKSLRIKDLRVSPGGTDYTAVWRPGTGTQVVRLGLTSSEFVAANAYYAKKGLRITSLDTSHRITAVWRPSSHVQTITIRLTTPQFAAKLAALANASTPLRPVLADYYKVSGQAYWVGVFEQGTGAYQVRTTSSATVWHNDVTSYGASGLRLVGLGSNPYTGVWRPGTGAYQVRTAPLSTFQADTAAYYKQGLRLVRIGRWMS